MGRFSVVVKMGWVLRLLFDVVYLGPGPPRGGGGVNLDCELNVSYAFVESGYIVNDVPGYPRVKGMRNTVDWSGQCVLS